MKNKADAKDLVKAGKDLAKKIDTWESNIVEGRIKNFQDVINWPGKLNIEFFNLRGLLDTHDPVVTQGIKTRLADLETQWAQYKKELDGDVKKSIES